MNIKCFFGLHSWNFNKCKKCGKTRKLIPAENMVTFDKKGTTKTILKEIPYPTNERLEKLFIGIDKVIIKEGGVFQEKALSDKLVSTISQLDIIHKLSSLLHIDEQKIGFHCMCYGTYAIELYSGSQISATIGFHHGNSIRYNKWNGDAFLTNEFDLLNFLTEHGLTKTLEN